MALVCGYRLFFKAWLGNACRFDPTCSAYALLALERHGALRGSALVTWRLLRCHPGCAGGHDPVPENRGTSAAGLFTGLLVNTDPLPQTPRPRAAAPHETP